MTDATADHKIVILGAGTVGKSSITVRMVADTFKGWMIYVVYRYICIHLINYKIFRDLRCNNRR